MNLNKIKKIIIFILFTLLSCNAENENQDKTEWQAIDFLPGKDSISETRKYYRDVERKKIFLEAEFTNNVLNGILKSYFENGKLKYTAFYNNGILYRNSCHYNRNGKKIGEQFFSEDGILLSKRSYNSNEITCRFEQFDFHSNHLVEQVMDSAGKSIDSQIKLIGKSIFIIKNKNNEILCVNNHNLNLKDTVEMILPIASVDNAIIKVYLYNNKKVELLNLKDYLVRKKFKFDAPGVYKYLLKVEYTDTFRVHSKLKEDMVVEFSVN